MLQFESLLHELSPRDVENTLIFQKVLIHNCTFERVSCKKCEIRERYARFGEDLEKLDKMLTVW